MWIFFSLPMFYTIEIENQYINMVGFDNPNYFLSVNDDKVEMVEQPASGTKSTEVYIRNENSQFKIVVGCKRLCRRVDGSLDLYKDDESDESENEEGRFYIDEVHPGIYTIETIPLSKYKWCATVNDDHKITFQDCTAHINNNQLFQIKKAGDPNLPSAKFIQIIGDTNEGKIEERIEENFKPQIEVKSKENFKPQIEVKSKENFVPQIEVKSKENFVPQIEVKSKENFVPQIEVKSKENFKPQIEVKSKENYVPQIEVKSKENYVPQMGVKTILNPMPMIIQPIAPRITCRQVPRKVVYIMNNNLTNKKYLLPRIVNKKIKY